MSFKIAISFDATTVEHDAKYKPYIGTVHKAFEDAKERWESVIIGPERTLKINAFVERMDGPGRILGEAGPTKARDRFDGTLYDLERVALPVTARVFATEGIMRFDIEDLAAMIETDTLKGVILHEMGHVLGIGTLWQSFVNFQSHNNPRCNGRSSVSAYAKLRGSTLAVQVPVENTGGPGTREGHTGARASLTTSS